MFFNILIDINNTKNKSSDNNSTILPETGIKHPEDSNELKTDLEEEGLIKKNFCDCRNIFLFGPAENRAGLYLFIFHS